MNTQTVLDAIVVGGGQAGLGIAYMLQERGRRFLVLERGRVGESWRSQRWDSFALNTPNVLNGLPGAPYEGDEPDGFWSRDRLVQSFERYVDRFALPVRTGATVVGVGRRDGAFVVQYEAGGDRHEALASNVVIASGVMQAPRTPTFAGALAPDITQLHTGDYRNAGALPPGGVLVVGGGQSGCQVVEDLLDAGRTVYLGTSKVARIPRRYRGRDILEWWGEMGIMDVRVEDLEDPAVQFAAQPQVSGVGRYGRTVSLQHLARRGVTLLGRATGASGHAIEFDDSLAANLAFADQKCAEFKRGIDEYIAREGIDAPPPEDDPIERPNPDLDPDRTPRTLDLRANGISAVIWCTGFTADFSWIDAPVFDGDGRPEHTAGITAVPGLYFLGFPWLARRKSGIICGIEDDATALADDMERRLGGAKKTVETG